MTGKLTCFVLLSGLCAIPFFATPQPQGWDYRYAVESPGTRSESVHGKLLYKGEEVPRAYEHVVTPIGEFTFRNARAMNAIEKIGWIPVGRFADGRIKPAQTKAEIDRLLSGKDPSCRRTAGKSLSTSNGSVVAGNFEQPPKEVGATWFYAVTSELWVNPEHMKEAVPGP